MKLKLTDPEEAQIVGAIQNVLNTGTRWEDNNVHHPAGALIATVLTIEGFAKDESDEDSNEGFTTNGWQYDWWQAFTYRGKSYTLSGSGFHGGHSFGLSDE